jgi:protein-S-isoprenylcysteine O-methyltransferase Ste14
MRVLLAQWVVIFYPGVIIFWLIVHNKIDSLRPFGKRVLWVAIFAWTITAGPILFFRSQIFSVRWAPPATAEVVLETFGVISFLLGAGLYVMAKEQISPRTMMGFPEFKPQQNKQPILQFGIYSKTRNPLYLGYWLVLFAAAALSGFAANWVMFGVNCLILPLLIRSEERELLRRFGSDYEDYMRRVPRFFPQLR